MQISVSAAKCLRSVVSLEMGKPLNTCLVFLGVRTGVGGRKGISDSGLDLYVCMEVTH